MMYLPDPCCTPAPIVTSCGCDPCTAQPIPSSNVAYTGPNLSCIGIITYDSVTVSFEKINTEICNLKSQIIALQNIVFGLTTTTTSTSSTSTTTSTTTAACPSCTFYSITNDTITPVNITYLQCGGILVNAFVAGYSTIYVCACTGSLVVPPLPGVSSADLGTCPTTTTTTSSSSTTTTTTTSYTQHFRSGTGEASSDDACLRTTPLSIYGSPTQLDLVLGMVFYSTSTGFATFNGNNEWWRILWKGSIGFDNLYTVQISNVGVVLNIATCPPTTTTTTTI